MHTDAPTPDDAPDPTVPSLSNIDPARLKGAHERTGRMMSEAGLPFEDDELDEREAPAPPASDSTD